MEQLQAGWQAMSAALQPYLPRFTGALVILVVAWLGARLARSAVQRGVRAAGLEARLQSPGLGEMLGGVGSAIVWLLALPALLSTLELQGLLTPFNVMLSKALGFVPNLVGSAALLGVGLLAARVLSQIVEGVLTAAGSEKLAARVGLESALGGRTLASMVATALRALILLPVVAAALQALALDAVSQPVTKLLDTVAGLIPRLISAAVIVILFTLIGRALASLATTVLVGLGFNALPARLGLPMAPRPGRRDASELAGTAVMAAVVLLGLTQASEVLGFGILTETLTTIGGALVKVATAALVLVAGLWLAALAASAVEGTSVAHATGLGRLVRGIVWFFAAALALRQAGLPAEIVAIAFGGVVGAAAIAVAVAMGIGGRHVAEQVIGRVAGAFGVPAQLPKGQEGEAP